MSLLRSAATDHVMAAFFVNRAEQALRTFGVADRANAERIFPLWRHYRDLTDDEQSAVLARFPTR